MGNFYTQNSCTYKGSAPDGRSLFMVSVAAKQRRDREQVHEGDMAWEQAVHIHSMQHAPSAPSEPLMLPLGSHQRHNYYFCIRSQVWVFEEGRAAHEVFCDRKQGRPIAGSGTRGNDLTLNKSSCRSDATKKLFAVEVVRQ